MTDSKLLHFLKNFPAWLILTVLFLVVLWLYIGTADQFFQRVVDTILGALLGILTGRAVQNQVSAQTIETGDIKGESLSNLTDDEINKTVENLQENK